MVNGSLSLDALILGANSCVMRSDRTAMLRPAKVIVAACYAASPSDAIGGASGAASRPRNANYGSEIKTTSKKNGCARGLAAAAIFIQQPARLAVGLLVLGLAAAKQA